MKALNRLLEAVASDKAHRVERSAVGIATETVDRNDVGVLETARDFSFLEEARPAVFIIGVAVLDFFQGDLAVQLLIASDKHFS